ncbi:SprB repeat-containing protein, partial [Galbibacter sp. EGI 63066]|uniref:SprB repeat-containing protein n=1 Tax=Galbibacter sp. EGI 63066 TaxID=2993559 RepID=UPI002248B9D0
CHGGNDGWAEAVVSGGTPPYSYQWDNNAAISKTTDLSQGAYGVTVTDSRGCQVSGSVTITAPMEPLQIDYTAFDRPTSIGASDGWIRAEITGGTALADGSYNYVWRDENGSDLNGQATASVTGGGTYQVQLDNLPSGTYSLTVEDANYGAATTKDGCTVLESPFTLYEPIEATIEEVLPISCNSANSFENPFSDGVIMATVEGGVPFDTGEPYSYHWKKQDASGNWVVLPEQTSEIAADLSVGNYALNVEDSMGNVIGVYQGNTLVEATDVVYDLGQPELLTLSFSSTAISCGAGNDGTATVQVNGGSGDYFIAWSNGATTATATALIA